MPPFVYLSETIESTSDNFLTENEMGSFCNEIFVLFSTMKNVTWLLLLGLLAHSSFAYALEGKVINVADGDTITVLTSNNQQIKIRLYGIDCPEGGQAYGKTAKKFTAKLVARKQVQIKQYGTDKYGRTVGIVTIGHTNVNEELIRSGYAWQYRKYCMAPFCSDWLWYEDNAHQEKRGLWKETKPIPPWEWRVGQRSNRKKMEIGGKYNGNVKSHVFHAPGCQHYNCKNCIKSFNSIDEAIGSGYRPHTQCVR